MARVRLRPFNLRLTVECMGTRPAGGTRAAAVRAAQAATAPRIKALEEHERLLGDVLADYFEAKAHAEKIRADAKDRVAHLIRAAEAKAEKLAHDAQMAGERLIEQAEKEACTYDTEVGAAVRRLLELGEPKASIAEMTGLQRNVVGAMERQNLPTSPPATSANQTTGKPSGGATDRPESLS